MTQLVHTADVHLRSDMEGRFDALETVLKITEELGAEVLTIGGDLFDRPEDVETLRTRLRNEYFVDRPFEVLLIPGNHDVDAFRRNLFFGDACTVFTSEEDEFETWSSPDGNLRIVAIPYQERATDELLLTLANRANFDGTDVMLFHGSLDAPFDTDSGEEGGRRYFPISEQELASLDFDYYLAGHYHNPQLPELDMDAGFAYSGTPAATRRSETGRRGVVTLDQDQGLSIRTIDTVHYLSFKETISPGEEEEVLENVANWVERQVRPTTNASVTVDGYISMDESEFASRLADAAGPATITNRTRDVERILAHPVLTQFVERLEEKEWDEKTRTVVKHRMLRAATESGVFN